MLRRDDEPKQSTFADVARAARSVPDAHVLMQMYRAVDWRGVDEELGGYYDPERGRASYPPSVMVRLHVVQQFGDLSDEQVEEQVGYNLLYRRFVGLGIDDRVPDKTSLTRFRGRVGEEGLRQVFDELNRQWEAAGLIGSGRRVLDGVHLWAKVARRSWVSLMRRGRELVVEAVAAVDAERAAALRREFAPADESEPRGPEALEQERAATQKLLEAVRGLDDERVRERGRLLGGMLQEGDRPVSFVDPEARWGHKAPDKPFLGYKAHESIDPDSRMITGVQVVSGNANEAVQTERLLASEPTARDAGAPIIGDGLYQNATTLGQVEAAAGRPCFSGLKAERVSDAFLYDATADQMICPQGRHSIGKTPLRRGQTGRGDLYYFSMHDCAGCPRRETCLTAGERCGKAQPRRRVFLSDVRKRKVLEGQAGKAWRREQLRVRGRIEAKFDEQMNRHGLRRARYWGLAKVTVQVLLNAMTVNLKRAAKLLRERAGPPDLGVVGAMETAA